MRRPMPASCPTHVGVGSTPQLIGEMFKLQAGLPELVQVPYRGAGPAIADLSQAGRLPHCQYRLIKQSAAVEESVQQCSLQSVMQIEIIACIALNPDYSSTSRRVLRYPVSESSSQSMMPVRKLM